MQAECGRFWAGALLDKVIQHADRPIVKQIRDDLEAIDPNAWEALLKCRDLYQLDVGTTAHEVKKAAIESTAESTQEVSQGASQLWSKDSDCSL